MRLLIFLLFFGQAALQADPQNLKAVSPDGKWAIEAHWIHDIGYRYQLTNLGSGKSYFDSGKGGDQSLLPHRLDAIWNPTSSYVALTIYYGRAMQEMEVMNVAGPEPAYIDPHLESGKVLREMTLLHPEDVPNYDGYNRLLTGAESWRNATDLVVGISGRIFLKNKKTGVPSVLDSELEKTVRFTAKGGTVIASEFYDYTIEGNTDSNQ